MSMTPRLQFRFVVDDEGHARAAAADVSVAVETVAPGEYLVTLPMALEYGVAAEVADERGFITATPGDEAGNKPPVVRVLTLTPQATFGPRDFTLVVSAA